MSNDLIFGVLAFPESNSRLCRTHFGLDLHRGNGSGQIAHTHQIVGRAGEDENPIPAAHSAMPNLAHPRNGLQPAEALFDGLPLSLAHGVAHVSRGAAVNRATARSRIILRHMRSHSQIPAFFYEVSRVKSFVPTNGDRLSAGKLLQHDRCGIALGRPIRLKHCPPASVNAWLQTFKIC